MKISRARKFEAVCEQANETFNTLCRQSQGELAPMVVSMVISARALDLRATMLHANDIRGVARLLGSALVADTAEAIFHLCEIAQDAPRSLPPELALQLAESCLRLVETDAAERTDVVDDELRELLGALREKYALRCQVSRGDGAKT